MLLRFGVDEYAALVVGVVQLRTIRTDTTANSQKYLRGAHHSECRRKEVDPERVPIAGAKC